MKLLWGKKGVFARQSSIAQQYWCYFFDSFMYGHGHIGLFLSMMHIWVKWEGVVLYIYGVVFTDTRNQDYNACSSKPVIISSQEKQIKKLCIFSGS